MPAIIDGPATHNFQPVPLRGGVPLKELAKAGLSPEMTGVLAQAPSGSCVAWGIPFRIGRMFLVKDEPITLRLPALRADWLVFLHTSDVRALEYNRDGLISPMHGRGHMGELAAEYVIEYEDGGHVHLPIRRRRELGAFARGWGENCADSVAAHKPHARRAHHEQMTEGWGRSQGRAIVHDWGAWVNWLWAWHNPRPHEAIRAVRCEPRSGVVVIAALSAGQASDHPLRWRTRRKAVLTLPVGEAFKPELDAVGRLAQIQLDMGQVISALRRPMYPERTWAQTYNNKLPEVAAREVLIEYTSHADACFHLASGRTVPVAKLEGSRKAGALRAVTAATQRVKLRVVDKASRLPVPVKLHVHGEAGEYLAPVDRHRIPDPAWFEDYSVDFAHEGVHWCTYVPGETVIDLPLGRVFIEVSRGFEIKPVRKVLRVAKATREITVEIEKVLPWREKGWVSADTHVHFLSPKSALLEGSAEGVNIVNLLASQWGELMTNVGDFDGRTTFGAKEFGGDGEHLVRVGTENRQHVMGHISLLGYGGEIIAPMTTGGADESALGDPVGALLTEWARQCKAQGGVVVVPHFPNPRLEHAAAIVDGQVDGIEMTAWGNLYGGIDPYTLSDWYRYLNCGCALAAVGGTDKMEATTAVGTVRTYAQVEGEFTYEAWKEAIRRGRTFVTYGPLLEFSIDGHAPGSRINMSASGGTVDVMWRAASVTVPMSRVELMVNGEIRESVATPPWEAEGHWSVQLERSSWLALMIRGHYRDKPQIIAAHSSPVMVDVQDSPFHAAADALTILAQIEGALGYLDTVGTRAPAADYKRMRLVLVSAYQKLHDRMHRAGVGHPHHPVNDHPEHHGT